MVTEQEAPPLEAVEAVSVPSPALQRLLDAARVASPYERIGYRDPIAAHGREAMTAVTPWLSDRVLAAFAVRVILYAGVIGDHESAVRVLQTSRSKVPPIVREDVDSAIRQLHQLMPNASWHTSDRTPRSHAPSSDVHGRPGRVAAKASAQPPRHPDHAS